ncbi:MAG: efflux RND transporter permease subunit [Candidatus Azobacteroides sp.]|nr:efflux RND transporter permease subunit [Candidatus Azobacteroides sp.]
MKLYETSVKKPVSTILIFIGIVVFGLYSLSRLAIDLYPDIETNQLMVITSYVGASSSDIEENVTRTLEDGLNTVNNLKKLTSVSQDNLSIITIEFEWGTNLDLATNDVRDKLDMVVKYLPEDVDKPIIFKFSTDMIPVLILSATAKESMPALYKILDDKIANPLNRINGVGAVSISGAPKRQVLINVDPQKLEAYNLTVEQIGNLIAGENKNTPGGTVDIGSNSYSLRVEGEFTSSDEINDVVVGSVNGKSVFVKDIAVVKDTLEERAQETYITNKNGTTQGAMIVIQKQSGANSVDIADKVMARLPDLQKNLPQDVKVGLVMNTSTYIVDSISSLTETVLLAFAFVVIVVVFFLGRWRATIIIILTIPVSLISAFIYLMISGNTINIISLSSLSIAIGMVVDDAIVVLENITTHIERGSRPKEAAIYGTNEVAVAVVASTLTVIAVFFPLTMITGMAGVMFKQLGWMVTITITVSVLCAMSLTPMLASQMMRKERTRNKYFDLMYGPIERFLDKLDNTYAAILNRAVRHRTIVVVSAFGLFFISILFPVLKLVGTEFFPASDNGQIAMTIQLPVGTRTELSRDLAQRLQSIIEKKYPETELSSFTVGVPDEDNTWAALQTNGSNVINYRLRMTDLKTRKRNIYEISDSIRSDLDKMPEIYKYEVIPGGNNGGMSGSSVVDVEIIGHDFEVTDKVSRELSERMKKIVGLKDIRISRDDYRPEYQIDFDREKLALAGLNTSTVSQYLKNRVAGLTASRFREDGDEYDIIVRYDKVYRESLEDIENVTVYNAAGTGIKIKEIGKVVERFAPPKIERQNRNRIVKVSGTVSGASLDKVVAGINEQLSQMEIPSELGINIGGSYEDQQESFGDLFILLGLIVMLVYIVMAAQFESFSQPFIIMLSVLFAFTGVFLALFISRNTLNMISMIGAIMLVGIVVKNGIVLIDYINLNRERGDRIISSVVSGGKSRLRPVLMTTATTILGMLPMALGIGEGSEIWQPMGIAIIGGLTVSTLLTLVVVPTVYTSFAARGLKKRRKKANKQYRLEKLQDEFGPEI